MAHANDRLKILLLGPGSVSHTQRWANGLAQAGVDVVCASQHDFLPGGWQPQVERVRLPHAGPAGYLRNAAAVRRLFRERGCALLNAHYATGYGVLATLSGVRPRMVSVWGSDVFDFPRKSPLHRAILRAVLSRATGVGSTSVAMADEVRAIMGPRWAAPVALTPFGVDAERFVPVARAPDAAALVIGTVKTLEPVYGIDTLIRAFALLCAQAADAAALRLRLVGGGSQRAELEALARELGVAQQVEFVGPVVHAEVPRWLEGFDVFVAASRAESFGVAVIEAAACGLPVVVTRVGGLPETVVEGRTGLIVEPDDPPQLARALLRLAGDRGARQEMGRQGRDFVLAEYEWRRCVARMVDTYRSLVAQAAAPR